MVNWLKEMACDLLSWGSEVIHDWWEDFHWYDALVALGLVVVLLPFEEIALLLSAPIFLTGIPQIDLILGIGAWLGVTYLWFWVREVGLVLLWFAGVRISQVVRKSVKCVINWHQTHGRWWLIPITVVCRVFWDLLGAYGSKLLWKLVVHPLEEGIRKNSPEEAFFWRRKRTDMSKPPPTKGKKRKPKAKEKLKDALPPIRAKEPRVGQGVVEFHLTPIGTVRSKEELVHAQATYLNTGRVPKGYRLHSDIRIKADGKVYSFAFPKAKRNQILPVKNQVFNSTDGHGTKLMKNEGIPAGKQNAVFIPSGTKRAYGHGLSWVVDERDVLYWAGDNNLHLVWGADTYVTIQTKNGLLMFRKDPKLPSYTKVVKGRSWDFKDISGKDEEFEAILKNPNARIERKYPDHFHVMVVDKEGHVNLYSRRASVTGEAIDKSLHVPHLSHIKVPSKYWDSEFEVGLYMDKSMPAVEAEQLGAGILNSYPARAVQLQEKHGQLKLKLFGMRRHQDKSFDITDRNYQEPLLAQASRDVRPDGKLIWHIPKQWPKDAKLRQAEYRKALSNREEGQVIWLNGGIKHKPELHADLKVVEVNASTNLLQGAGSFTAEDRQGVKSRVALPVPHAVRRDLWSKRDELVGRSIEVKHRDTPSGQALQDARFVKFED